MAQHMRTVFSIILCTLLVCAATGCGKPHIELDVASHPNVNPDYSGRPSPVIVKLYELKSDLTFRQGDFNSLFSQPVQTLGADLVAADELVFVPSEAATVTYELMPETRFVGLVAGFRQMDRAEWRGIVPVSPEEKKVIRIQLSDVSLALINDEDWKAEDSVRQQQLRLPVQAVSDVKPEGMPSAPTLNQASTVQSGVKEGMGMLDDRAPSKEKAGYILPQSRRF